MDTTYIWNKLYLCSSKIIVLTLLFVSITTLNAQHKINNREINLPNYDNRRFHYGFTVAVNGAAYNANPSDFFLKNRDSVLSINPQRTVGFTLGFVINYHISDNMDFRVLPNVGFYKRDLKYKLKTVGTVKREIESNVIELPMLLKYKSQRKRNFRAYIIGGIKPGIEVASNKKQSDEENLRVRDTDLVLEYGIGLDIYNPMFKFSPEIRFAHGLKNMLINDPNVYSQSLDRLSTHTITLYFHFE